MDYIRPMSPSNVWAAPAKEQVDEWGSETITIFVGKERKLYRLHKTLLCAKCPYFQRSPATNVEESCTREVILQEEGVVPSDSFAL